MSKGFYSRDRKFKRRYVKAQGFEPERKIVKGLTIDEATNLASKLANERSDTTEVVGRPNDYIRLMVTWDPS